MHTHTHTHTRIHLHTHTHTKLHNSFINRMNLLCSSMKLREPLTYSTIFFVPIEKMKLHTEQLKFRVHRKQTHTDIL